MTSSTHGVINHPDSDRKTDYLYRISIKGIILNDTNEILFVKEDGREYWDLPGGGMDHGENIKEAIARELSEEVNLTGAFTYRVIHADDPAYLEHINLIQVRLIVIITPKIMEFSPGEDGDEVAFLPLDKLKEFDEQQYNYIRMILDQ